MKKEWVDSIHGSCRAARAHFFFKQWGGVQKAKLGRTLNGRTYDEMPSQSKRRIPARSERLALARILAPPAGRWSDGPLVQIERRRQIVA
jgi:hypothetical protein